MAAFTSVQVGPWNSGPTWGNGGSTPGVDYPADGDTFTLGHEVTVPAAGSPFVVGNSPETALAIGTVLANAGTLTLADDAELHIRGGLGGPGSASSHTHLRMGAGSTLKFDSSQTVAKPNYVISFGEASGQYCLVDINGTEAKPSTVGMVAGGSPGVFLGGNTRNTTPRVEYCNFEDVGTATLSAWNYAGDVAALFDHCTFTRCGRVDIGALQSWAWLRMWNCNFNDTVHATHSLFAVPTTAPDPAVDRHITNCAFDKLVQLTGVQDMVIDGTIFGRNMSVTNETMASMDGCAFGMETESGKFLPRNAVVTNSLYYTLLNTASAGGQHWALFGVDSGTARLDTCVFDGLVQNGNGDVTHSSTSAPTSAVNLTLTHCLTIPSNGTDASQGVSTLGGNALTTLTLTNNTFFNELAALGEDYAGHAGMVAECKSNIVWGTTATRRQILLSFSATPDLCLAENITHNVGFGLLEFYKDMVFSSGTPGANDMSEDPQFVDSTVNMAKWAGSIGEPATYEGAANALLKLNRADHNPQATVPNLLAYLRNGFAPRNQNLKQSGHNGNDRGAVPVAAPLPTGGAGNYDPFASPFIRT